MNERVVVFAARRAVYGCSFATQSSVQMQTLLPDGVNAEWMR